MNASAYKVCFMFEERGSLSKMSLGVGEFIKPRDDIYQIPKSLSVLVSLSSQGMIYTRFQDVSLCL